MNTLKNALVDLVVAYQRLSESKQRETIAYFVASVMTVLALVAPLVAR